MPARPVRSPLSLATGRRLRELREDRGLSVAELARLTGLGKGTLSELETGRRNPTLETLYAVTTALGVSLSAALPPGEALQPGAAAISGEAIDAVLVDRFEDADSTTELYRIRLRAGRHQDSQAHAPGVTEHWIVYAGNVAMGPVGRLVNLGPGDSTKFTADVPHRYLVDGAADVDATLLVRYPRARP
jgi:XRE family transcriptional regulator, regulator of sulfur utilization